MKRPAVGAPVILLALFLLYSFVLKEKFTHSAPVNQKSAYKSVFKSTDGGETWQDISEGLPDNLLKDGIRGDSVFANDNGLFVRTATELYLNTPNSKKDFWTKEILPGSDNSFFGNDSSNGSGKSGIFDFKYWGINLKKLNGTMVWSPIFDVAHEPRIRTAFETSGGDIFFSSDEGFFKSADGGKTWKLVLAGGYAGHMADGDGVMLATAMRRTFRSTDNGDSWELVTSDTSVVFDVKHFNGGFAAMTATSVSNPRGLKLTYDGGKTWESRTAGNTVLMDSIARTWNDRLEPRATVIYASQYGEDLISTYRDGIYKSSDNGKTWKLLIPPVRDKVFNLFGSGKVIYAITSKGGC